MAICWWLRDAWLVLQFQWSQYSNLWAELWRSQPGGLGRESSMHNSNKWNFLFLIFKEKDFYFLKAMKLLLLSDPKLSEKDKGTLFQRNQRVVMRLPGLVLELPLFSENGIWLFCRLDPEPFAFLNFKLWTYFFQYYVELQSTHWITERFWHVTSHSIIFSCKSFTLLSRSFI